MGMGGVQDAKGTIKASQKFPGWVVVGVAEIKYSVCPPPFNNET